MARAHPSHRGAGRLRAAIAAYLAGTMTRSDLEDLFLAICRRHGLPQPIVNHPLRGKEVDFLFAEQRLIVEIDSWRYHPPRLRRRPRPRRTPSPKRPPHRPFTDRRLEQEPDAVAATLRALLAQS
jgi:hypothetical protein